MVEGIDRLCRLRRIRLYITVNSLRNIQASLSSCGDRSEGGGKGDGCYQHEACGSCSGSVDCHARQAELGRIPGGRVG
jgi:hypothetical protein